MKLSSAGWRNRRRPHNCLLLISVLLMTGCQSAPRAPERLAVGRVLDEGSLETNSGESDERAGAGRIHLTGFPLDAEPAPVDIDMPISPGSAAVGSPPAGRPQVTSVGNELSLLESLAQSSNPGLRSLLQEANAASMRTRYVDRLPDPTFGANVFGHPIETAAGSQRANLTLMQMIPWLDRLDAQQQQACFEALALRQQYAAERLRVIADVRAGYYELYVLTRQIETVEENQRLLETSIEIVNARVSTGSATPGDVLLGTLELSRLEEQRISLRQRVRSTEARINRLVSRSVGSPVAVPDQLQVPDPTWSHEMLVQTAWERQPVIAAAQLRANATRWGVDIAKLRRRPDVQVGAAWFLMDDNRPATTVVDVGRDAWSLGATVTIPLDHTKYDAIREEALWKHAASASAVQDLRQEFDARLLDLLEQARAASETATLYRETILPQSEQTLVTDQESLANGNVEYDRVIQDFRNLVTLQFGYHRAVGQLATSLARIEQTTGADLQSLSSASQ